MAGRGTVNRVVQVGVESTPGTAVAADKQLPLTSLVLSRALEHKEYRAQGFKPVTGTKIVKDFGNGQMSGPLNYTEIVYLLSTLVTPTISAAGVNQVETATAAGTVSGTGTATAIVTAAGMTGSPVTVTFNVTTGDTPAVWAALARAALAANANVASFFTVSGSSTAIILTARVAAANDATMNIALDNGTSTGITTAGTSANTTAGSLGATAKKWLFSPTSAGTDAFKTLTIQEGDSNAAVQMAYAILTDFGMSVQLDDCTVSGTLVGRSPANASLTSSPTVVAQLPAGPREIDLYMDTVFGTQGLTPVTDALSVEAAFNNKQALKWVLSTSETSFKETIEVVPTLTFSFQTEHNAQSRTLFASVSTSANPVQYLRLKATGPVIEGSIRYSFILDVAAQVTATEQTDVDGVWGYKYDCVPVYDASFLKPWQITVVNTIASLA